MRLFNDEIKEMVAYYEWIRNLYTQELSKLPAGRLSCIKKRGRDNYFRVIKVDGKRVRKGITSKPAEIRKLARKEYINKILPEIDENLWLLRGIQDRLNSLEPDEILTTVKTAIARLPREYFLNGDGELLYKNLESNPLLDNMTAKEAKIIKMKCDRHRKWAEEEYNQVVPTDKTHPHVTSRGLRVRSKSEALICERFYELGVPFRYEQIVWTGKYELAPDFTFESKELDLFFHEHAGMMAVDSYRDHHNWKMREFARIGIRQWDNLIVTYDMNGRINMALIDAIIRYDIIPRL